MKKNKLLIAVIFFIVFIMIILGISFSNSLKENHQKNLKKYTTALQINNEKDFNEAINKNNNTYILAYGTVEAVDPISYSDIPGEYMYIKRKKQKYTMHTRKVRHSNGSKNNKTVYYTTEIYHKWDTISEENKHCNSISFLGQIYDYDYISNNNYGHLATIDKENDIRYEYYGTDKNFKGTMFAYIKDHEIKDMTFYNDKDINTILSEQKNNAYIYLFWFCWIIFSSIIITAVYCMISQEINEKCY